MTETAKSGARERRSDAPALAVVDLALIAGLVLLGQVMHRSNPIADPVGALAAIAPFAVGWLSVAFVAGLYRRPPIGGPLANVRRVAVCWLAASNVGFLLRGTPYVDGAVPWEFMVVFAGIGLAGFVAIRGAYALARLQ